MEGSLRFGRSAPHGGRKDGDVEVKVNGDHGPVINFRVGLTVIINLAVVLIGFAVAVSIMKADVDALKVTADRSTSLHQVLLDKMARIETTLEYMKDELRYQREKENGTKNGR
jgi:hypothetical protein